MKSIAWDLCEPLGWTWRDELLHLDLTPGVKGAERIQSVVSNCGRIEPAQLATDGSAIVTFQNLEKNAIGTLTAQEAAATGHHVHVTVEDHAVRFANARCAVRFAATVSIENEGDTWRITGPIQSLTGPDGIRRCGSEIVLPQSRFFSHDRRSLARVDPAGTAREEAAPHVTIEVEARGPVFAVYRYRLTTGDGRLYEFKATLYSHWPLLLIEESSNLDRDGELKLQIGRAFNCDQYFHGGGSPNLPQRTLPLPTSTQSLGRLTPHHTQTHTAYTWMGFFRSDRPQGSFHGTCDAELEPCADAIVVMGHRPWNWTYPADSAPRLRVEAGRGAAVVGGLRRGTRAWCLMMLNRKEAMIPPATAAGFTPSPMAAWHRRLNDLPLDWVRRLNLAGDVAGPEAAPALLSEAEWAPQERAAITQRIDSILARSAVAAQDDDAWYLKSLLHADPAALESLKRHALAVAENKLSFAAASGFLADNLSAVANRALAPLPLHYEILVRSGAISAAEQKRLRTILLLFAHASMEDAIFPSHLNYRRPWDPHAIRNWAIEEHYSDLFGTPNFQTDVYLNLGIFGAVFRNHPQSDAWMHESACQMDQQLDFHFHPGGVYEESIGYFAHMFHAMLLLASILRRHGQRDFFADARFQAAMECLVDYLGAPRRPTLEQDLKRDEPAQLMRFWPSVGDTGYNNLESLLTAAAAHAAWEVREHNPALADKLLAGWNESGRPVWGGYPPKFELLYFRDLTPTVPAWTPRTRTFQNVGHHMRADVGLPSETSIFLRSGKATHHWGFDHGHFTMTTRGSLLVPDFGYYGKESEGGRTVHGFETWIHNVVTFGPWSSGYMGPEQRLPERVVRLQEDLSYVVVDLTMCQAKDGGWRNTRNIMPIQYQRHFLFAHNRYVFVWDRIDFSTHRSQLRLHCLAESVQVKGDAIRFRGLDDVDLLVHLALPSAPELREGLVGRQRYLLCEQESQRDYLWVAQPVGPQDQPFTISSHHMADAVRPSEGTAIRIAGTDLHGTAFEDHILCVKGDFPRGLAIGDHHYNLQGRLALVRREGNGKPQLRLLDGQSLEP